MKKSLKITAIFLLSLCVLCFSGCSFIGLDVSELIHPPKASGDESAIQEVIDKKAGNDYILKYPSSGDNRSAITMADIDADGENEALSFVSTDCSTDRATTHLYIIDRNKDGKWVCINDFTKENTSVDRVDILDLNGDKEMDISVGYTTYSGGQNQLVTYIKTKDKYKEVNTELGYSSLAIGNFTEKGKKDIMLFSLALSDSESMATLVTFDDMSRKYKTYFAGMDST
ncbi:MAG: hypothetical protein ACI4QE_05090, partial [Acutalibacteraceae bacterium]